MSVQSIQLKNTTNQIVAAAANFLSAALLFNIPLSGKPAGQITFKHTGTAGYWYIKTNRSAGPSSTDYSFKLAAGEAYTEKEPPFGDIYALADGSGNGSLSAYGSWRQ
jgi:hypothetical protein